MGEKNEGVVGMNSRYPPAYRKIAQIAKDVGILEAIPENEDVLSFVVDELFQHISVVAEHISDDLATSVTQ